MTDKLTEALEWVDSGPTVVGAPLIRALAEAARRWAEFPTDTDVEAAAKAYLDSWAVHQSTPVRVHMRAALEAVKREDR